MDLIKAGIPSCSNVRNRTSHRHIPPEWDPPGESATLAPSSSRPRFFMGSPPVSWASPRTLAVFGSPRTFATRHAVLKILVPNCGYMSRGSTIPYKNLLYVLMIPPKHPKTPRPSSSTSQIPELSTNTHGGSRAARRRRVRSDSFIPPRELGLKKAPSAIGSPPPGAGFDLSAILDCLATKYPSTGSWSCACGARHLPTAASRTGTST